MRENGIIKNAQLKQRIAGKEWMIKKKKEQKQLLENS